MDTSWDLTCWRGKHTHTHTFSHAHTSFLRVTSLTRSFSYWLPFLSCLRLLPLLRTPPLSFPPSSFLTNHLISSFPALHSCLIVSSSPAAPLCSAAPSQSALFDTTINIIQKKNLKWIPLFKNMKCIPVFMLIKRNTLCFPLWLLPTSTKLSFEISEI